VFALVALACLTLAGVAYAGNGGAAPPAPRSPNASRIEDTYYLLLGIAGAIFVLVEAALILFIVRFRHRGRSRAVEGPQIIGHSRLELIWTIIPVLILAAIAGFVFYKLPGIKDVPSARAGTRMAVRVEGHQFYWRYVYPDGTVAIDRLRVPVDEVVTLSVVSPDVAHSWWVPALGGKIDAIPGRTNRTWFRATRLGTYAGTCGEFCGLLHAFMRARVEVVAAADYRRFVASHGPKSPALGAEIVSGVCAKCHGLAGQGDIGPKIAQNPLIANKTGLTDLLRNGRPPTRTPTGMPAVGKTWSQDELNAAIAALQKRYGAGGAQSGS
jgi:cytochrome c oxidase subunit 2